jgi:hypothetical protein
MNDDKLPRLLTDLPRRLPVVVEDSSVGWMKDAELGFAPGNLDRPVSTNPDHLKTTEPPMWAPSVDTEADLTETKEAGACRAITAPPAQGCATSRGRKTGNRR